MRIFVPKETLQGETRVPLVPATAARLVKLGAEVEVQADIGATIKCPDANYELAGAKISAGRERSLAEAEIVLRLRPPPAEEIAGMKRGCIHISYLNPFAERALVGLLASAGISAICIEMIPRSTVAQKMDALSSQANLAGYVAVILAAGRQQRIFPMMMTPAGTIKPLRVFVIGVGVAGLQAIATARRLGAQVEAFDTRPVVEEQVRSLGASFVKIDLGESGQTAQGYAKELTPEQLSKQRELMGQRVAEADVVITAAQVFGRKAPVIVTAAMVKSMKPGSVLVDLAIESGGNVEGIERDRETEVGGVKIIGLANLPGSVAATASEMYSNNLGALIEHFWDKEKKAFRLDPTNDILRGCLITHDGAVCNETLKTAYATTPAPPP
jgi:H+-translocating NAD(P) transhydrogenase subunit alpha